MDAKQIEAIYPLAPQQQGVFLESRAMSGSGMHIEQLVHTLPGSVDVTALERAWQRVVERHPMLRTAFVWKGQEEPLQVVLRSAPTQIAQEDWQQLASDAQQERLEAFLLADRRCGFELNRPPLARFTLLHTGEDTYVFVQTFHHILVDGWSIPLINADLAEYYLAFRMGTTPRIAPTVPYRDYVAWLKKQDAARAEEYWSHALDGWQRPTPLGRLSDHVVRTDEPPAYAYAEAELSEQATEALQALARRGRITMNTILQGAWALLLSRYSGERDVVFGTTVSGRPADLAGLETTVGLFVNTPPFRVTIPQEGSLLSWLQTLQAGHARLRQFEYCSTGQIHQWSKLPAAFSLFESALVYENYPETHTEAAPEGSLLPHLQQFRGIGAQTRYAIALLAAVQQRLMFRMTYDRRRFDGEGGGRVLEHFLALLNRMATDAEGPISTLLAAAPTDQIPGFRLLLPPDRVERGEEAITAPRTPTETILADICAEVLGLERVGIDENLLELGAHSLLLTQVVSRIRSALKTELPLSAVFDAPSVAGIARILHARQFAGEGAKPPALQPTSRDRTLPLSFAQQRLWLIDQLNPGQALYNTAAQIRLMGPLDRIALEAGFTEIVARHEVLRTVFATQDEEPIQVILPPQPVPLPYVDLRALPDEEKRREVQRLAEAEELKPFDLAHDRMLRVQLLGIEKEEHLLLLTLHHIASDRWSFEVLLQELKTLYEASVSGHLASLPALPIQYADYAVREREVLGDTVYASQLEYWRKQLAHIPSDPLLATDYPRPEKTTYPGEIHSARLAKAHSDALLALARQSGCSSYMLLLAAFHVLLGYRSEQTTIVTGANVANRTQVELEGLIGFFVNQIVLRSDLAGNPSFREYLGRVREMVLEGYAHQEVPFDMVVADQKRKRTLDLTPLFQVLFVQNTAIPPIRQSGLTILSPAFDPGISRFDLAVFTGETDEGTVFEWLYRTDLFSQATVARMADHLIALLEHLAANPEARISDLNAVLAERDGQQRRSENRARAELGKSLFKKVAVKAVSFEADP